MQELSIVIRNKVGLHARPASLFVKTAKGFKARIRVRNGERTADAKSILNVLTLGAGEGANVTLSAEGEDEAEALAALRTLIESNFGEPG